MDVLVSPKVEAQAEGKKRLIINKKLHAVDESGLVKVGVPLRSGDIYINKKTPAIPAEAYRKGKMYEIRP
jgi:DNA-directed RNA polymerase beta subunit